MACLTGILVLRYAWLVIAWTHMSMNRHINTETLFETALMYWAIPTGTLAGAMGYWMVRHIAGLKLAPLGLPDGPTRWDPTSTIWLVAVTLFFFVGHCVLYVFVLRMAKQAAKRLLERRGWKGAGIHVSYTEAKARCPADFFNTNVPVVLASQCCFGTHYPLMKEDSCWADINQMLPKAIKSALQPFKPGKEYQQGKPYDEYYDEVYEDAFRNHKLISTAEASHTSAGENKTRALQPHAMASAASLTEPLLKDGSGSNPLQGLMSKEVSSAALAPPAKLASSGTADTQAARSHTSDAQAAVSGTSDAKAGVSGTSDAKAAPSHTSDAQAAPLHTSHAKAAVPGTSDAKAAPSGTSDAQAAKLELERYLRDDMHIGVFGDTKSKESDTKDWQQVADESLKGKILKPVPHENGHRHIGEEEPEDMLSCGELTLEEEEAEDDPLEGFASASDFATAESDDGDVEGMDEAMAAVAAEVRGLEARVRALELGPLMPSSPHRSLGIIRGVLPDDPMAD
eukprot:gnl/TRDRNA2_/TRDRNA2_134710_c2_seq1.p1 gnl/TRDRNA2_/TRDRNA2_134710_c2~~gnl/TRDRNA2_/TRDRNA2_134710_c2_seq1.p1  ORF type:complete len:548 (-),score=110.92 gnl/TRDRNA2_/TRDRNA2_134710_c2_seq1:147-1682(-)